MNIPPEVEAITFADRAGVTDLVHFAVCLNCGEIIRPREMKGRQHGWMCDNCDPLTVTFLAHLHAVMEELKARRLALIAQALPVAHG